MLVLPEPSPIFVVPEVSPESADHTGSTVLLRNEQPANNIAAAIMPRWERRVTMRTMYSRCGWNGRALPTAALRHLSPFFARRFGLKTPCPHCCMRLRRQGTANNR
jgi:hypothetical protein